MKKKPFKFYIICSLVVVVITLFFIGVSKKIIEFVGEPELFRLWVNNHGIFGPIVYVLLTIVQILACFVPGEPLELVAGYAFGTIKGTILCLLAESIGSIIVILLIKKYGRNIVELFFEKEKIDSLKILKSSPSKVAIFSTIFILPGTPKDLLCYVAGLTDIKTSVLITITTFGRIPAIITSVIGADALGNKSYLFAIIIFALTILLSLIGIYIYNKLTKNDYQSDSHSQDK